MKLNKLHYPEGNIVAPTNEHHYCDDCPTDHVHLTMDSYELHSLWGWDDLYEDTYRDVAALIDGNFLNQKIRTEALESAILERVDEDTLVFGVKSSEYETNHIVYQCLVQFDNWDEVGQDPDLNAVEKARLLLWTGNIKLHCSDPSFLYWGYQWIETQYDIAIYPEDRPPVKNNPQHRGICCKHLNLTLQVLPFNSGKIATAMKEQFG